MKDMKKIYQEVASELIRVYNRESTLVLPRYYNKESEKKPFRVSEQESKIIFSNIFYREQISFSVEVPTKSKFCFTREEPKRDCRSARYDMAIYEQAPDKIKYAIELKAHNVEFESIRKDIEKFARSDLDCIWFHTLEKADANTYETLLKKFNAALQSERCKITGEHQWEFVIVALENEELYFLSKKVSESEFFQFTSMSDFLPLPVSL